MIKIKGNDKENKIFLLLDTKKTQTSLRFKTVSCYVYYIAFSNKCILRLTQIDLVLVNKCRALHSFIYQKSGIL